MADDRQACPAIDVREDPIDDLVLAFCVGDDNLLDERLVAFDVRASIARRSSGSIFAITPPSA